MKSYHDSVQGEGQTSSHGREYVLHFRCMFVCSVGVYLVLSAHQEADVFCARDFAFNKIFSVPPMCATTLLIVYSELRPHLPECLPRWLLLVCFAVLQLFLVTSTLTAYLTLYATLVHQGNEYPR